MQSYFVHEVFVWDNEKIISYIENLNICTIAECFDISTSQTSHIE